MITCAFIALFCLLKGVSSFQYFGICLNLRILDKFIVQLINVYEPKYETAGKFWPIVHNSMIFSLVLMHAIAVGIFTIKKLSTASTLIFPLPVLTLLFNEYCRKRFLPNFIAYPAEVHCHANCCIVYPFLRRNGKNDLSVICCLQIFHPRVDMCFLVLRF